MHQFAFGGRVPPGLAGGAYSASPEPLAGLRGKERGKREGEMKKPEDPPLNV